MVGVLRRLLANAEADRLDLRIVILMGNHDYLKANHAYFEFLGHLDRVVFVARPQDDGDQGGALSLFLPHTKTPVKDWAGMDFSHFSYLFMHQTAPGSVASNGQEMDGEELPSLKGPKVYSGDIHVPQVIGDIEYIGSPYHVHFGDAFTPRCILIDARGRPVDLHFETISRLAIKAKSLRDLKSLKLKRGDQVKVTITLDQSEAHQWGSLKRQAEAWLTQQGVEIHGLKLAIQRVERRLGAAQGGSPTRSRLSDPDAILRFVEREDLGGAVLEAGLEAMK